MNTLTRPLTWIAAAAMTVASLPAMALEPFKADYLASYMGMQANGTMTLASEGSNKWRYSLQVKNQLADLSQSTVFEEVRGQLRPLSSQDRSALLVKKRNVQANYNWTSKATWTGDIKPDRAGPIALKAGDMDALLINLAIARDRRRQAADLSHGGRRPDQEHDLPRDRQGIDHRGRQELRGHQGLARRWQQGADRLDRAGLPGAGAHAAA